LEDSLHPAQFRVLLDPSNSLVNRVVELRKVGIGSHVGVLVGEELEGTNIKVGNSQDVFTVNSKAPIIAWAEFLLVVTASL